MKPDPTDQAVNSDRRGTPPAAPEQTAAGADAAPADHPFSFGYFGPGAVLKFTEANRCVAWWDKDSEAAYRARPHDVYGPNDIEYRFNSSGYRSNPFDERKELNVIIAGCSHTFGAGLAWLDTYGEVLRQELTRLTGLGVQVWNFGMYAGSNDIICRVLIGGVEALSLDAVFVYWSGRSRREQFSGDGKPWQLGSHTYRGNYRYANKPVQHRQVIQGNKALISDPADRMNAIRNMKTIEYLLRARGTFYLCSSIHSSCFEGIEDYLDPATRLDFRIEIVDRARDHRHPGPQSNRRFAVKLAPVLVARMQAWRERRP